MLISQLVLFKPFHSGCQISKKSVKSFIPKSKTQKHINQFNKILVYIRPLKSFVFPCSLQIQTVFVFRGADQCHEERAGKIWNSNASLQQDRRNFRK